VRAWTSAAEIHRNPESQPSNDRNPDGDQAAQQQGEQPLQNHSPGPQDAEGRGPAAG